MLKKLRIKFICFTMTIVTVMLCIMFALVMHFTKASLEQESLHMMQAIAMNPIPLMTPYDITPDVRLPYFTLQVNHEGELITTSGGFYDLSDTNFLAELIDTSFSSDDVTGTIDDYNLRYFRVITPASQFLVFSDTSSEQSTLDNLLKNCLLIGAISFLVFFVISILLANWAIKPVEKAWIQQRQFIADASHELKTPLTVILTNAEMMQTEDFDELTRAQFSRNILTMSHQMQGLVENMLNLARVDNGTTQLVLQKLNFSSLISDALLPFEPIYYEKNMELLSGIEENIIINASESHMVQLISILLDNARKYSYPHSAVTVRLQRSGKKYCTLSVSNPGETISPADLKNIFKRFYRIDKARSMNQSYGLGLSIADSIVTMHKGKIWCESANGFNTFYVKLKMDLS